MAYTAREREVVKSDNISSFLDVVRLLIFLYLLAYVLVLNCGVLISIAMIYGIVEEKYAVPRYHTKFGRSIKP